MENTVTRYQTFAAFYPFYLSEHADRRNRRLHFAGTSLVIGTSLAALLTGHPALFWLLPILGYGCAWVGHFFFEHNKPATFQYPLYSLIGDFVMYKDIWIGRVTL